MSAMSDFYQVAGLNAETYDEYTRVFGGPGVNGDVDFYVRCAQQAGGPVLELGAGTGRVAWAVAQAGYDVTGLDRSTHMLRAARAKADSFAAEVRDRVRFVEADMSAFDLGQTFALVISPFRAFQALLTPDAQRACLNCVHRHLRPGGSLVLDLFDPRLDLCLPNAAEEPRSDEVRHPRTGHRVSVEILSRSNDPLQQVLVEPWRFTERDATDAIVRQEHEMLRMRWTYRREMRYLLELTGFAVEAEYSDFIGSPPAYGAEQVWVARRI